MSKKVRYLSRDLVTSPIYYALCLTEEQFHAELKRRKVPERNWSEFVSKDAAVHFLESNVGSQIALVTLKVSEGISLEQIYGLLVHEAVHIWQAIREALGETHPGVEQEAYSIQRIAQSLMESYRDQTEDAK